MATESVVADLRLGIGKFNRDFNQAAIIADKHTKNIEKSLERVEKAIVDLPSSFKKFNDELKRTQIETEKASKSTSKFSSVLGVFKGGLAAFGITLGAAAIGKFGRDIFQASQVLTAAEIQLKKVTGSTQAAAEEMAFVNREADRLSINSIKAAQGYAQLAIAAKGTSLEGKGVRDVFIALNEVSAVNRLSTEEYSRSLIQLNQVFGKGKADLEDFRTLSEALRLPLVELTRQALKLKSQGDVFEVITKGKLSAEAFRVVMIQIREEYAALAEEAANTTPRLFSRAFSQIQRGLAQTFQGVLESKELNKLTLKLFGGRDLSTLFGTKEEVTERVDFMVAITTKGLSIMELGFKAFVKIVKDSLADLVNFISNLLAPLFDAVGKELSEKFPFLSKFFKGVTDGFSSISEKLKEVGANALEIVKSGGPIPFLFGELLKNKDETLDTLDQIRERLAAFVGVELPSDEAANKTVSAAQSAEQRILELKQQYEKEKTELQAKFDAERNTESEAQTKARLKRERKLIEDHLQVVNDLENEYYARLTKDRQAVEDLVRDFEQGGKKLQERIFSPRELKELKEWEETYKNLKENIQETLGDTISGALSGDLGNIQNVFDSIKNIATNTAGQIAASFIIDPLLERSVKTLLGPEFKESGQIGGTVGNLLDKLGLGGEGGAKLGKAAGGAASGIAVGAGLAALLGGGKAGGAASGAIGGALAGLQVGAALGPYALVGAAIGAAIGGIGGFLSSEGKQEKLKLITQTDATLPGDARFGIGSRSPFGVVSLFDESTTGRGDTTAATQAIAEVDAAIARFLDQRQRAIVEEYFRAAIPEGSLTEAKAIENAIAESVQLRYFQAISLIAGRDVAENVVGQPFTANQANIDNIQQRAQEALAILKTIEEFKVGPLSQAATAIKGINEEFQILLDRAVTLGLPTQEILAEQNRRLQEVTDTFNQELYDALLSIENPDELERVKLARVHQERIQNAIDANADLLAVDRLNFLEREQLEEKLGKVSEETGRKIDDSLIKRMEAFNRSTLSSTSQALANLKIQFESLRDEALEAGLGVAEITASYRQQAADIRRQGQIGFLSALSGITSPFKAAMLQMGEQVREFRKLANEGIISQSAVNQFEAAARRQARLQEAQRIASGQSNNPLQGLVDTFIGGGRTVPQAITQIEALTEQFLRLRQAFNFLGTSTRVINREFARQLGEIRQAAQQNLSDSISQLISPFETAFDNVREQIREFGRLASAGIVSQNNVALFSNLAQGNALIQQAIERLSGGAGGGLNQVADAFQAFIDRGSPLSNTAQAVRDLTRDFRNAVSAANLLGFSTRELESSYVRQIQVLREQAQEEINARLQPRIDALKQIDDYIKRTQTDEGLPANLRIDAARRQFRENIVNRDVQGAVSSAETFRQIARETFGSSARFYSIENEIERMLLGVRQSEQTAIEQERARLVAEEQRQIEAIRLQRSSLDALNRIRATSTATTLGVDQLLRAAQAQAAATAELVAVMRRVSDRISA